MIQILQPIADNSLIALLVGIFGIVLTIFFYYRSTKERVPCYLVSTTNLIDGVQKMLPGLDLIYNGVSQNKITITKIIFWNAGGSTIDNNDIPKLDPIKITIPNEVEILDVQLTSVISKINAISIGGKIESANLKSYDVMFDFLDKNDYFVVQIVHTGETDTKINLTGKVKGVKKITRVFDMAQGKKLFAFRSIALMLENFLNSRLFLKYVMSSSYLALGLLMIWGVYDNLIRWYAIPVAIFFLLISMSFFIINRRAPPIKI